MTHRVHVWFRLAQDADGYPPVGSEEVGADIVDSHTCRIVGTPLFAFGVAPGDLVSTGLAEDGRLWATGVVESAGQWVFRLIPCDRNRRDLESLSKLGREFDVLGCRVHPSTFGLLAVSVPGSVDTKSVVRLLEKGEADRRWYFDLGVDPMARS